MVINFDVELPLLPGWLPLYEPSEPARTSEAQAHSVPLLGTYFVPTLTSTCRLPYSNPLSQQNG
jgi:hypothetical protein